MFVFSSALLSTPAISKERPLNLLRLPDETVFEKASKEN
jgi:hypothetical protein